ncbi:MAG: hypothetical protein ENTB_01363 [Enterocloster aldenensis]
MITVKNIKEAWELAARLFPVDYVLDDARTERAGYPIWHTTAEGVNAWISDLTTRLELNYPNGSTENIWIEQKKDTVAVVGMYQEKTVFGDVKVKEVKEITYHNIQGIVNKTLDDGRFGIVLTLNDGEASFGCESVAYIRFE